MTTKNYGDWSKLTDYLRRVNKDEIVLTDDELAQITGSVDKRNSPDAYFPIDDNRDYSILARAAEAGYSVEYDKSNPRKKLFKRIKSS